MIKKEHRIQRWPQMTPLMIDTIVLTCWWLKTTILKVNGSLIQVVPFICVLIEIVSMNMNLWMAVEF